MQQFRGFQRIATATGVAACLLLVACTKDDPEQAVRSRIQAMQAAIDARDAGDVEDLLAKDFVGSDGMDRHAIRQLAVGVFLRHKDVAAKLGPVSVELRGESDAIAKFSVLATGGSGGFLPESGQLYQVESGWRLVDGEWRLLNATWTPNL